MKTIIIEDEKAAVRNLVSLLSEVKPDLEVLTTLDSIVAAIEWLRSHAMPDVVFMDIHLADGSAFEIFEHVSITCPVVFTTAYDEYALRAFRVNSIDYLLKPIAREDVEHAFSKLSRLQHDASGDSSAEIARLIKSMKSEREYKTHFLIPVRGDKLLPVAVEDILMFYIDEGQVKAVLTDETEHIFPHTLDELADEVSPMLFFRVNRQYLLSREVIRDIDLWFGSRLSLNLSYAKVREKIIVSKPRVKDFKEWFSRKHPA